jgi:hypothetical protein
MGQAKKNIHNCKRNAIERKVEVKIAYQVQGNGRIIHSDKKSTDAGLEPAASCSEDKRSTIELAGHCCKQVRNRKLQNAAKKGHKFRSLSLLSDRYETEETVHHGKEFSILYPPLRHLKLANLSGESLTYCNGSDKYETDERVRYIKKFFKLA